MDLVKRFEVYLVNLDPTLGREMKKTRPCVVISPDVMNKQDWIVIIAPLTSTQKNYPTRVPCAFQGKQGDIALEYLRSVDCDRLIRKVSEISSTEALQISSIL
ncbi:MAG: type II toxin-antitoxin system PemK/MazF family toxin, partial [Deltaproteobacteria bacterium]|nr:type II toxin-antitoxin system PemK/MazF family toxin [Deltaproteobacteria bacterium]